MADIKPCDKCIISYRVYDYEWDGYKDLLAKFRYHNLTIEQIIDLSDVGECVYAVVSYLGTRAKVPMHYLEIT